MAKRTRLCVPLGLAALLLLVGPARAQFSGVRVTPAAPAQLPSTSAVDPNAPPGAGYNTAGYVLPGRTGNPIVPPGQGGFGPGGPGCGQPGPEQPPPRGLLKRLFGHVCNDGNCHCETHHNEYGCGSLKAEAVFIFGSCRAFWGDRCRQAPPKSYENWPGITWPLP